MSGSETGVMTNTSMGIQNMHLAYSADGAHSVYKPVPVSGAVNAPAAPAAYHHQAGDGGATPMPKKKRGRPRKYAPDGNMGLALAPPPPSANTPPASVAVGGGGGGFSGGSALQFSPSQAPLTAPTPTQAHPLPPSSSSMKKARGRPPGSGKKSHQQQPNTLGSTGIGFTPHVITVKAGEDVASRIMSFSQHGPRAVCILSANGAISNVTLRQAAMSGGTVTYEGRFEILSLSGSFMLSESAGHRSRIGGLSVSLSGPDGCVLGGGVAGLLTAASPVQVVVGSFMAEERKESRLGHQMEPLSAPYPGFTAQSSPQSRGTPSESSGGPGSPLNQSMGANCNNNNQSGMLGIPWK